MKWEYKVIEIEKFKSLKDPVELQKELNNYGTEGWELVGILQPPHNGKGWMPNIYTNVVTFKRKIEN